MDEPRRRVLLTILDEAESAPYAKALGASVVVRDLAALQDAASRDAVLLSFSTSVIVPETIFSLFTGGTYNLHAASPDYPGRDPHHFAVYEGAVRYGATLHHMAPLVDAGPIVDVELFDVPSQVRPGQLLTLANLAALRVLQRAGPRLARGERLEPLPGVTWSKTKRSRGDFLAMCRITPQMPQDEIARRVRAFDGEGRDNLYMEVDGRRVRFQRD